MPFRVLAALTVLIALPAPALAQQRLPTTVMPRHYDLSFVVDLAHARFEGSETIRVHVEEPTSRIVLNAVDLQIRDVTIGAGSSQQKATVTFDEPNQTATLTVPRPLAKGEAEIRARFTGVLNDQLRGFYLSKANGRNYAVTQFESTDARRAFPCFDEPAFKATFALTVTVDRADTAISNGKVLSDGPGPAPGQHTMTFATTPRMSSYLVAITVGDFQCLEGAAEGVPIRICATADKKQLGGIALEAAQQLLTFYNSYYSIKYPFGKLDVVAVPDFAAGAMENTGAIFYRETYLLADARSASVATRKTIASVLAHEMAHQWFGDLVTMRWWDDIWLNEGFATWMANKPLESHAEWHVPVDEALETQQALDLDSLASTRPVQNEVRTPAQIDEAFDVIAYQKGAAVLRMIENYVGTDAFRKGVNAYLEKHAYGNATSEDFYRALSASSGKPVERILPTFVSQPGVPLIDVRTACTNDRTAVTLQQQRLVVGAARSGANGAGAGAGEALTGRWQVPVCVKSPGQQTPTCDVLSDTSKTVTLGASGCAPWVFANAGAEGYYRTAYAPDLLRAIAPHVSELTAPERLSLIADEWAMVRAGRHAAGEYLTLAGGFGGERVSGVLEQVAGRLGFIHEYLAAAEARPRLEQFVRGLLRPLFDELGLATVPSEPDDRRALRAVVVDALGTIAGDRDVAAMARAALDTSLAGGTPIEATVADAVVHTAAVHGDAKLFDALAAAAERATAPEDHYRYLNALASVQEPALIDRALQLTLSASMRSQDAGVYLARFFGSPAARSRAWEFVKRNWSALEPKMTIVGNDARLVASLGQFCDAQSRDAIAAFFAAHPLPGAARALQQTIERINNCVALREAQTPAVTSWLNSR